VVELRRYTVQPGQADVLIELFDRAFVETQEEEGMTILGQFRNLDRPDEFVWLRGFPNMPERARALGAFYQGPTWKAHGRAANATMVDVSNVLLLRPSKPGAGFLLAGLERPGPGAAAAASKAVFVAAVHPLRGPADDGLTRFFESEVRPALEAEGASVQGAFVTESSPNTFPALPVREGEPVFVLFCRFEDGPAYERHLAARSRSARWGRIEAALARHLTGPPESLRLGATARSLLGR
jgi:hypothetical protein